MKRVYLIVEGPHDVELVGRLLKWWGLRRAQKVEDVGAFWRPLIPSVFPHNGDLLARVPVPTFFLGSSLQVAVSVAIGDSKIARTLNADLGLATFDAAGLEAIGVILDADDVPPPARWTRLRSTLAPPPSLGLVLPVEPNVVAAGARRFGALVLPGDGTKGTLEDLLLACAGVVYPRLLRKARTYLAAVEQRGRLSRQELGALRKASDRKKALVATIATPLKPGKAIQVSIQDNAWLSPATRGLPAMEGCLRFMAALLGSPLPDS